MDEKSCIRERRKIAGKETLQGTLIKALNKIEIKLQKPLTTELAYANILTLAEANRAEQAK
jgi:hypothetical protein